MKLPYTKRLILHAPPWDAPSLETFVEDCLRDSVILIAVVGPDCGRVENVIDELVVGDGSDDKRSVTTTSHPDETLDEVKDFTAA